VRQRGEALGETERSEVIGKLGVVTRLPEWKIHKE